MDLDHDLGSDDWTDELLSDAREVVMGLLAEADVDGPDLPGLAQRVIARWDQLHHDARPLTDLDLADVLADATLDLLDRAAAASAGHQRLASVAARYFVLDDGGDLASPFGFDDDIEVFNAVAARIAPELVLDG